MQSHRKRPADLSIALERIGALELLAGPEFDRRKAQRQAVGGHRQAGMHKDTAHHSPYSDARQSHSSCFHANLE